MGPCSSPQMLLAATATDGQTPRRWLRRVALHAVARKNQLRGAEREEDELSGSQYRVKWRHCQWNSKVEVGTCLKLCYRHTQEAIIAAGWSEAKRSPGSQRVSRSTESSNEQTDRLVWAEPKTGICCLVAAIHHCCYCVWRRSAGRLVMVMGRRYKWHQTGDPVLLVTA